MSQVLRGRRVEGVQELAQMPRASILYGRLQASSLVTAAAVARFTNPRALQLVIFKEWAMEVWEVDDKRQRKVFSKELQRPVSHCRVIETSKLMFSCKDVESTPLHLDLLLVTDGSGGLMVCDWNETLSEVQESGQVTVHLSPELASEALPSSPLFSCPLYLPERASLQRPLLSNEVEHGKVTKVEGFGLVAVSLFEGMLEILCVEWISTYSTLSKECGVRPLKSSFIPRLNLHFVPLLTENLTAGPMCMVLDLSTFWLRPGPWEIRNVNPSTALLLPWSFAGDLGDVVGIQTATLETVLRPGSGVLVMSSASMTFVEACGRRASLPLHLDGLPSCCVRLPQRCLVIFLCSRSLSLEQQMIVLRFTV